MKNFKSSLNNIVFFPKIPPSDNSLRIFHEVNNNGIFRTNYSAENNEVKYTYLT